MRTKRKVLIVDDHPVVREGLTLRINPQPDLVVCGEARNRVEALKQLTGCKPDIAVVDPALKGGDGLDLIRDITAHHPVLPVLVFSAQDEQLYAFRAIKAGAKGWIAKNQATEKVVEAIRNVLDGQVYLSDQIRQHLINGLVKDKPPPGHHTPPSIEQFSDRELEVYRLLGAGLRSRQIAARLHLSISTIQTYCDRIKLRLHLDSHGDLVREAVLWVNKLI